MNSNNFCLGSPSYKKVPKQGRKKKREKRCEIGKSQDKN